MSEGENASRLGRSNRPERPAQMKRYRLTKTAQADIDGIWLYVAKDSGNPAPAERLIWRFHKAIVNLASQPEIGLPCPDIDKTGLSFPVGNYMIYYRHEASLIAITHVFDGRRDQKKAWRRGKS
jgi:toxin ParE1/3/4